MKNKSFFCPAAVLVLILLIACETVGKKPDWIKGRSQKYPASSYLIGIGQAKSSGNPADDQASADQNARAEIARQIQTRIQSQLVAEAEEELQRLGPDEQERFSQRIKTEVSASEKMEIEGIKIAERFYDEKAGIYYTLAVLDRRETGDLLLTRIRDLNQEAGVYLGLKVKSLLEKEPLMALNYLARAEAVLRPEIKLRSQYLVISGAALEKKYHLADLIREEDEVKSATKILVIVFEKAPGQKPSNVIESYLISSLSSLGFHLISAPAELRRKGFENIREMINTGKFQLSSNPHYLILGNFEVKKNSQTRIGGNLNYFYKTGGELCLFDLGKGKILLSLIDSSPEATKAGKTKPDQAISLSLEQAGKYFSELWLEILKQKFFNPATN